MAEKSLNPLHLHVSSTINFRGETHKFDVVLINMNAEFSKEVLANFHREKHLICLTKKGKRIEWTGAKVEKKSSNFKVSIYRRKLKFEPIADNYSIQTEELIMLKPFENEHVTKD